VTAPAVVVLNPHDTVVDPAATVNVVDIVDPVDIVNVIDPVDTADGPYRGAGMNLGACRSRALEEQPVEVGTKHLQAGWVA
jgi:hypothetical protein